MNDPKSMDCGSIALEISEEDVYCTPLQYMVVDDVGWIEDSGLSLEEAREAASSLGGTYRVAVAFPPEVVGVLTELRAQRDQARATESGSVAPALSDHERRALVAGLVVAADHVAVGPAAQLRSLADKFRAAGSPRTMECRSVFSNADLRRLREWFEALYDAYGTGPADDDLYRRIGLICQAMEQESVGQEGEP